jgi:lysozyme
MTTPNQKKSLAAIVGAAAASTLLLFVPAREGTVYHTYRDQGGVLTYCDGATESAVWGATYTPEQCRAQLDKDLAIKAVGVMACIHVPLTDGQKVAFVDVAYNIGVPAFCSSSMARKTNAHDPVNGCNALLLWDKIGTRVIPGLLKRRQAERQLCLKGLS